jgi:hypothetical protein
MIMAVAYLILLLYYRNKGGYQPVLIGGAHGHHEDPHAPATPARL